MLNEFYHRIKSCEVPSAIPQKVSSYIPFALILYKEAFGLSQKENLLVCFFSNSAGYLRLPAFGTKINLPFLFDTQGIIIEKLWVRV